MGRGRASGCDWPGLIMTMPGHLPVTITWLALDRPALGPALPAPMNCKIALLRADGIDPAFYRYLYDRVGEPWLWHARRRLALEALKAEITAAGIAVHVLYVDGVPAGYFELDRRAAPVIDLVYFGLLPQFIGRRLGPFLLDQAIRAAFAEPPAERLTVNTCTLDHAKALTLYQRFGFSPTGQTQMTIADPRLDGVLPMTAAPQIPIAWG